MEKKDINRMLEEFKQDFQLTDKELNFIKINRYVRFDVPGFEKRIKRMRAVLKEMKKFTKSPIILDVLLFTHDEDLKNGYFDKVIESVIKLRDFAKKMELIELKIFKKDFNLTDEELAQLAHPGMPDFKARVWAMFKVRNEMRNLIRPRKRRKAMRKWLFAHNGILGDTYYNLMVKGEFDKVLGCIWALKEGVYV